MSITFYETVRQLDYLQTLGNPTYEQKSKLIELISDDKFARYFFNDLHNPLWIPILYNFGFFKNFPEPIEVQPGSFQLPDWPAINYLVQFASQYEEIFVAIAQNTLTSNWRIQSRLIEGLQDIPPKAASSCTFIIDKWLDSPFSDMLPNDLIPLTNRFIESNLLSSAITITDFILKPVLNRTKSTFSRYDPPYGFRSDPYWVNEFCNKVLPRLMKIEPGMLVTSFQKHLEQALKLTQEIGIDDFEEKLGYYWRMDIAFRSTSRSDGNITDILIDGLRDSLIELCESSPEIGKEKVGTFLHCKHLIFQRIAIHTLRKFGSNYPDLLNETLAHWEFADIGIFMSEYRGLLHDQYANASEKTKGDIIKDILGGPSDLDRRTLQIAQWKNHEPTGDDRIEAKERWMQFYLELIQEYLPEKQRHLLEEFNTKYGVTNVEEKPKVVFSEWTRAESPITAEELAKKELPELQKYFIEYEPDKKAFNLHDSLARTFQSIVSKDPTKYLDFAIMLIEPTIRFIYTYNFLFGIRETLQNKGIKLTDELITLCEFVIEQTKDPFENPPDLHEVGLFAAQLEVAHLLNDAVQSTDPYLSRDQLDRIRNILISLAHHPNPTIEDDKRNEMSPFDHSLNCIRGEAMHGIFNYSRYLVMQKRVKNKNAKWFIEDNVASLLDEKIDIEKEPSPVVRSVIGSYLTQIYFMSEEWTIKNLDLLFPLSYEYERYWTAAWDGYLVGSQINKELFIHLIPQYQRGLKRLSIPKEKTLSDPSERLSQHVMVAYINNLTNFGHENHILDTYYENAPDGLRAQAIFWLSKVLENEKPAVDSLLWQKCWALWKNRLDYAETQEPDQNGQEMSDYMRWLEYCPQTLEEVFPMLEKSIKYFQDSFDVMQLTRYASKYCEQSPKKAVSLLNKCIMITIAKEIWWNPEEEVERKILSEAMKSNNSEAKGIAINLINIHGENGDYRWRDLLDL